MIVRDEKMIESLIIAMYNCSIVVLIENMIWRIIMKMSDTFSVRMSKKFHKPLKRYALEHDLLIYEIIEEAVTDFFKKVDMSVDDKYSERREG